MQACLSAASGTAVRPSPLAAVAAQRPRCTRVQAEQKGFSGGQGQKLPKKIKKSKRGKIASRPSPTRTIEQLKADQDAYEAGLRQQQQPAPQQQQPAAAAAAEGEKASAAPSSSSAASSSRLDVGGSGGDAGDGGRGSRVVEYGSTEAVPEVVTDRMLKRIVIFMGTPVFGGILLFPLFYYIKVKQGVDLPNWVAYVASSLTFGGGLLGISYGIMSASWDPRREGSFLGWTEFQANVPLLLDRFRKDK